MLRQFLSLSRRENNFNRFEWRKSKSNKSFNNRNYSVLPQNAVTATNEASIHHDDHLVPIPPKSVTEEEIQLISNFVSSKKDLIVITGAGISTESGVPDYRSPNGSYSKGHKPTTYAEFVRSPSLRQRYWARNMEAWPHFSAVKPNKTHNILGEWTRNKMVKHIVTQNVDRLHHKGGAIPNLVTELHGNTHEVGCLSCGFSVERDEFQNLMKVANPLWEELKAIPHIQSNEENVEKFSNMRPSGVSPTYEKIRFDADLKRRADGDVDLGNVDYSKFNVPPCPCCKTGIMKVKVVFFGENVPAEKVSATMETVKKGDGILVVGTSLMVYSVFRFIKAAADHKIPIGILNIGETRADDICQFKVQGQSGDTLTRVWNKISH